MNPFKRAQEASAEPPSSFPLPSTFFFRSTSLCPPSQATPSLVERLSERILLALSRSSRCLPTLAPSLMEACPRSIPPPIFSFFRVQTPHPPEGLSHPWTPRLLSCGSHRPRPSTKARRSLPVSSLPADPSRPQLQPPPWILGLRNLRRAPRDDSLSISEFAIPSSLPTHPFGLSPIPEWFHRPEWVK